MEFKVQVTSLSKEDIEDIASGIYSGCGYWCRGVKIDYKNTSEDDYKNMEYFEEKIAHALLNKEYIIFTDIEDSSQRWYLNYDRLLKGVERFISEGRCSDIGNMFDGNEDVDDMDTIIQYALFNEVMFC